MFKNLLLSSQWNLIISVKISVFSTIDEMGERAGSVRLLLWQIEIILYGCKKLMKINIKLSQIDFPIDLLLFKLHS